MPSKKHEEQFSTEKACGDDLKAEVTELMGQVMKVKELRRISCSKKRMVL